MLSKAAETLTQASGNLLDFFNVGGLARQRTRETLTGLWTHYSWRELFVRGGIIVSTAVLGYMAADTCQNEECSALVRGVGGAAVGFFASHTIAVIPTMVRRNNIKAETQVFFQKINHTLDTTFKQFDSNTEEFAQAEIVTTKIRNFANYALNLKLPITKRGDAIRNLLTIKNLLRKIEAQVNELQMSLQGVGSEATLSLLEEAKEFWEHDFETIQHNLTQEQGISAGLN